MLGGLLHRGIGNCELESRPHPDRRLHPNPPAVMFDNLQTRSQADPRARQIVSMQALKHAEDSLILTLRYPDSVVTHRERPRVIAMHPLDVNHRLARSRVFD